MTGTTTTREFTPKNAVAALRRVDEERSRGKSLGEALDVLRKYDEFVAESTEAWLVGAQATVERQGREATAAAVVAQAIRDALKAIVDGADYDSREARHARLAYELRRHADELDELADGVDEWGATWPLSPRKALGLIERGDDLARRGAQLLDSPLIGHRTKASHGNDAGIALGVRPSVGSGRGNIGYAVAYALGEVEQYGAEKVYREGRQSLTAVKASSLRVYAASCRVVAGICDSIIEGRADRIG